ncbi:MAG: hypothetical protein AAGI27_03230 [Pseudomonadota bacterium]
MLPFPHAHWLVLLFLLMTFAAFMPGYFAVLPTAPWVHHLHGITATLWVVLVATQNWTAHRRKWNWHVRSGIASMALVPVFTIGGLLVTHHMLQTESVFNTQFGHALSAADLVVSVAFVALYTLALRNRRFPDLHARYMLATIILLIGPSLARFFAGYVPGFLIRSLETLPRFRDALDVSFLIASALCLFLIFRDRANGKPYAPFVAALITTIAMVVSFDTIGYHDAYTPVKNWIASLSIESVAWFGLVTSSVAVAWGWMYPRSRRPRRTEKVSADSVDAIV